MEDLFAGKLLFLIVASVLVVATCLLPDVSMKNLEVCLTQLVAENKTEKQWKLKCVCNETEPCTTIVNFRKVSQLKQRSMYHDSPCK